MPSASPERTALSVNINKVALLRNSRHLAIPSPLRAAELCLRAGAATSATFARPMPATSPPS
jgi:pyridoxine 5-phosphate synthase